MSTHKSSRFSIPKREKSVNVHIWKRCDLEVFFQFGKFRYEATLGQLYSRIKERIPEIYQKIHQLSLTENPFSIKGK